ncbi:META domain-containing protein [Aliiroseovarius sp. YM-037]|uniref:META domain-containing protein n=1 Tax=Aliiroseovarius sp. YM-037 TaxID=3341728 RepID=UPI003A8048A9
MRRLMLSVPFAFLAACYGDETISGYADPEAVWVLAELNGTTFSERATLAFPEEGKIAGEAPCNRYFGEQTAPYPWISIERIGATKRACSAMSEEIAFLNALGQMTLAEVAGGTLILSNEAGGEMVFRRQP